MVFSQNRWILTMFVRVLAVFCNMFVGLFVLLGVFIFDDGSCFSMFFCCA